MDIVKTGGARNYWKTHNYTELSDELINVLCESCASLPSTQSEIFIVQLDGQVNTVPSEATAYPHGNIEFIMNVHTRCDNSNKDNECITWARNFYKATLPFATGGEYVNFVSARDDNIQNTYGDKIERLSTIIAK